jgi:hypothetical protein
MNKKNLIKWFGLIVVAGLIVAGAWFAYKNYYLNPEPQNPVEQAGNVLDDLTKEASQGVLPAIDPGSNPMKDAPDVNPVSKTNPFSKIKINPFK